MDSTGCFIPRRMFGEMEREKHAEADRHLGIAEALRSKQAATSAEMRSQEGPLSTSHTSPPHSTGNPLETVPEIEPNRKLPKVAKLEHLRVASEGLLTKLYRLQFQLDLPSELVKPSDAVWKAGILPDFPKLCLHMEKNFPDHPCTMQLSKVDKGGFELLKALHGNYLADLEPWYFLLVDVMRFKEQSLELLLDMGTDLGTLSPEKNPLMLHSFMDLVCNFIRVNLMTRKSGRKMIVQTYALLYHFNTKGGVPEDYSRLCQFVSRYDPPLDGLQQDLSTLGPRIGKILEAVSPALRRIDDLSKLRVEAFGSPYDSWQGNEAPPDPTPSAAGDAAHMETYRLWVLLGYLACPAQLLSGNAADILYGELKSTFVVLLFRHVALRIHEEYAATLRPHLVEQAQASRFGASRSRDLDVDYKAIRLVKTRLSEALEAAVAGMEAEHRQRRIMLRQELHRLLLRFQQDPSLLPPAFPMVAAALALAKAEVLWYFGHAQVVTAAAHGGRILSLSLHAVDIESPDPTLGSLLYLNFQLVAFIRNQFTALRDHSVALLAESIGRIGEMMEGTEFQALEKDDELDELFQMLQFTLGFLGSQLPSSLKGSKHQRAQAAPSWQLLCQALRSDWLNIVTVLASARSKVSAEQLDEATSVDARPGIVTEGNLAYFSSRNVEELEGVLQEHASLRQLCFYQHHLLTVFRQTMSGPFAQPLHGLSWLGLAACFQENAHPALPAEGENLGAAAREYATRLLEAVVASLDALVAQMEAAEMHHDKLQPADQEAASTPTAGSREAPATDGSTSLGPRRQWGAAQADAQVETAMHHFGVLVAALNEFGPVQVAGVNFIPSEFLREGFSRAFQKRIQVGILPAGNLQRPVAFEHALRRYREIVHLAELRGRIDLTETIREVLLAEAFASRMRDLYGPPPLGGPAAESSRDATAHRVAQWYVEHVVLDVKQVGVVYAPLERAFVSAANSPKAPGENLLTSPAELEAFVRVFGAYGVDCLAGLLRGHLLELLTAFEGLLRANRVALAEVAASMHDYKQRKAAVNNLLDLELMVALCTQLGHAMSLQQVVADACAQVLQGATPLIYSVLFEMARHVPYGAPEDAYVSRVKRLAGLVGATSEDVDATSATMLAGLLEVGGVGDSPWSLLPCLFATFMTSGIWQNAAFQITTGGFSNNAHCLAKCVTTMMEGCIRVGAERRELKRALLAQQRAARGYIADDDYADEEGPMPADAVINAIQSAMESYVQSATCLSLAGWETSSWGSLAARFILLDQVCEMSPWLPRSTLETSLPYVLIRSAYQAFSTDSECQERPSGHIAHQHLFVRHLAGLGLDKVQGPTAGRHLMRILPQAPMPISTSVQRSIVEEPHTPANPPSSAGGAVHKERLRSKSGPLIGVSQGAAPDEKAERRRKFFSGNLGLSRSRKNREVPPISDAIGEICRSLSLGRAGKKMMH